MNGPLLWISIAIAIALGLLGLRLLRLAGSTGELPELLLGLFFVSIGPLGFLPNFLLSFCPGIRPDALLMVLGLGATGRAIAVAMLTAFTWRVFRADSTWAMVLASTILLVLFAGYAHSALLESFGRSDAFEVGWHLRLWPRIVAIAWCTAEPLRFYRMARRRVALGLMEPVVANHFLLWSLWGGACLTVLIAAVTAQFVGLGNIAALFRAAAGCVAGTAVWLIFFPTAGYRRWIERAAPRAARTAG